MNHAKIFEPCRRGDCANCTGVYCEGDDRWLCTCNHHGRTGSQTALFTAPAVVSVQPDLFASPASRSKS